MGYTRIKIMEPKEYKNKWTTYSEYGTDDLKYSMDDIKASTDVMKIYKDVISGMNTNYVNDEVLYAVKGQIEWATKMLKFKSYRKDLTDEEIEVLKGISNHGNYSSADKMLLNNILKKYNDK